MSLPSNLYAEKIFAEHPSALWSMDESIDYLSLISETHRDFTTWTETTTTYVTKTDISSFPDAPFPDSAITRLRINPELGPTIITRELSKSILSANAFDTEKQTVNIGLFVYADNAFASGYEIGYRYTDPATSTVVEKSQYFAAPTSGQWAHISHTFPAINVSANITAFFRIKYLYSVSVSYVDYYINGFTVGQWSEEFAPTSLGVSETNDVDAVTFGAASRSGIVMSSYGLANNHGYYMYDSSNDRLLCKNTSIPMAFGSSNITRLIPQSADPTKPNLIIPSMGMLGLSADSKVYTLEFWLRVNQISQEYAVLVSHANSSFSIFMEGPFIGIKIASKTSSGSELIEKRHLVNEWSRPMLIDMVVTESEVSLMINGERVISFEFTPYFIAPFNIPDYNWIGFYSPSNAVSSVELDCIAIYPYKVPALVAKRRFGFGQAVESPEGSNRSFGGQLTSIDYKFADYTNSYSYPDIGKWNQGVLENLIVDKKQLSIPDYPLPELVLKTATESSWKLSQDTDKFSFGGPSDPNSGYLLFNNFNILKNNLRSMHLIFDLESFPASEQVLLRIQNNANSNYFQVSIIGEELVYKLKYNSTSEEELYRVSGLVTGVTLFAGVNIRELIDYFGGNVGAFFGDISKLSIFVAGEQSFQKTFSGSIHKVVFSTENNFNKIASYFDDLDFIIYETDIDAGDSYFGNDPAFWAAVVDGGTPEFDQLTAAITDHVGSYTLYVESAVDSDSYFKIAVDSYWEDYLPLTYFAQYVSDSFGDLYYDLDFIQFNSSYPSLPVFDGAYFDTSGYIAKTYITFQYLSTGANAKQSAFSATEPLSKSRTIVPGDNWITTRYEVVDGTVIYPPTGIDINSLAISTHIEITVNDAVLNRFSIKKIEYASEAFNEKTANPVGTKFGSLVYPYTRYSAFYDYKARNPFRIYKGSTPHLYLTRDSGIELLGDNSPLLPRGFLIPINPSAAPEYKVIGLQMFLRSNQEKFSTTPVELFEIQGTDEYIRFFLQANDYSGKRARIYGINSKTGVAENAIAYYINGRLVREPVITIDEWVSLGIAFAKPFNFNSYAGALRFQGPLLVNNVAHYESSALQEIQRESKRTWFGVENTYGDWQNVLRSAFGGNYNWNDVLVISSRSYFGIDPAEIYNTYVGTNKIIVDDYSQILLGNASYNVITNAEWNTQVSSGI